MVPTPSRNLVQAFIDRIDWLNAAKFKLLLINSWQCALYNHYKVNIFHHTSSEIHMDTFLYNNDDVSVRSQASWRHSNTGHQENASGGGLQPLDDGCHDNRDRVVFRIAVVEKSKYFPHQIQTLVFLNMRVWNWKHRGQSHVWQLVKQSMVSGIYKSTVFLMSDNGTPVQWQNIPQIHVHSVHSHKKNWKHSFLVFFSSF